MAKRLMLRAKIPFLITFGMVRLMISVDKVGEVFHQNHGPLICKYNSVKSMDMTLLAEEINLRASLPSALTQQAYTSLSLATPRAIASRPNPMFLLSEEKSASGFVTAV
jgi:hypothetical protein